MTIAVEYETKLDTKKRCVLRGSKYEFFHVTEYDDGHIVLEPRVLVKPTEVSRKTLHKMDKAVSNLKKGKAGKAINLATLKDSD